MTRAIVHIGYHKTATTWFQTCFYPFVRNARYIPRAAVQGAFLEDTAFHFQPERALEKLGAKADEKVILCEEGLSGYIHNGGYAGCFSKEMAHRIKAGLPDADIVIFVRNQPSIIAASYQQYVKGGGTHSVRRYLFAESYVQGARREFAKCPRFTFEHFEYAPLIAHYQDLFGKDRVHVFAYEAFKAAPQKFLADFAARLGLDAGLKDLSGSTSNRSYGLPTMWIVRVLNMFTNRTVLDKHYIVHVPFWYAIARGIGIALNQLPLLNWSPGPRRLLGPRVHEWIAQRYARANAELKALTGLPLEDYGYRLTPPEIALPKPGATAFASWMGH